MTANVQRAPREAPQSSFGNSRAARPIDLAHLTVQTMGDRALEQEVLKLFVKQAVTTRNVVPKASATERQRLAHTLKGSARGVGAFALADCAAALEKGQVSRRELSDFSDCVDEVCNFVAAITR